MSNGAATDIIKGVFKAREVTLAFLSLLLSWDIKLMKNAMILSV